MKFLISALFLAAFFDSIISAKISLIGKVASQSETWSDRVANLAIDGDVTSFSVAASPTNSSALGWWEVDLAENYQIDQVILTASFDDYNAKYLKNFSIWLLDENRNQHLCSEYNSIEILAPSETKSFPCQNNQYLTRCIRITRDGGPFRPAALADVNVVTRLPRSKIEAPPDNGAKISLIGKVASQSETWSDRVANLAIDGNVTSFSVAASPTNSSALGWWEVDLEGNYQVGEVILTASFEDYKEISLIGKKATQSETWSDKVANLAIDGDATSFSVAASQTNSSALGWWEVDLATVYQIGQVILTASFDDYNAKYLQNFSIWLLDENRNKHLCSEQKSTERLAPSETRSFPCKNYKYLTRYIRIARDGGPFRPDAMALAEVNVVTWLPQ